MTVEERKNVKVVKGNPKELEEYKARQRQSEEEIIMITTDISHDGYYKEKIAVLEREKNGLAEECAELRGYLCKAEEKIANQAEMITKLKDAFIEAAIK